jgi:ATP-dependent RNA helicase DDX5/DBP2
VVSRGGQVPDPLQTFDSVGFSPEIMREIQRAGYAAPTPIQAQSWAVALRGSDLISIAKTGSGKTCGFLLPGFMHCAATRRDPRVGPTMAVLAPTRELAVQIKEEADKFGRSGGFRNTCCYGASMERSLLEFFFPDSTSEERRRNKKRKTKNSLFSAFFDLPSFPLSPP